MLGGRDRPNDDVLRRTKLRGLLRRLLSEADALRAVRSARLSRLVLPEANAVDQAALLLRPERLLPQAVDLHAAVLAGLV